MAVDPLASPSQRPSAEFTRMLKAAGKGDASAAGDLFTRVYHELRSIAGRQIRDERRAHTLGATALVHEVYVRLIGGTRLHLQDRAGFFHAAAEAMRRILIEHARKRGRQKRGGQRRRIPLDAVDLASEEQFSDFLAVEEALRRLEQEDGRAAEVVRLRFFAGLSVEEVAQMLDSSPRSVAREWAYARAWLYRALGNAAE